VRQYSSVGNETTRLRPGVHSPLDSWECWIVYRRLQLEPAVFSDQLKSLI